MKTLEEIYNENGYSIEQLSDAFNKDALYLYELGQKQNSNGELCDLNEVDKILVTWESQYWSLHPRVSSILKQSYKAGFKN